MEKVWTKSFESSDDFGFFDFLDAGHVILYIKDFELGWGSWIYKIGSPRAVGRTVGAGPEASTTSKDGRFLFISGDATLTTVDLRGLSTSISNSGDGYKDTSVIYPNPVQGTFTIQLQECVSCDVTWEMISLTGARSPQAVGRTNERGSMTAQLPTTMGGARMPQGRYTLRAMSGSRTWSFVLVVQ